VFICRENEDGCDVSHRQCRVGNGRHKNPDWNVSGLSRSRADVLSGERDSAGKKLEPARCLLMGRYGDKAKPLASAFAVCVNTSPLKLFRLEVAQSGVFYVFRNTRQLRDVRGDPPGLVEGGLGIKQGATHL
jgi:hypothetical protein